MPGEINPSLSQDLPTGVPVTFAHEDAGRVRASGRSEDSANGKSATVPAATRPARRALSNYRFACSPTIYQFVTVFVTVVRTIFGADLGRKRLKSPPIWSRLHESPTVG